MINIFNLFLTFFFFWALFGFAGGFISMTYFSLGLLICLVLSFLFWQLKIIKKSSNLLFLHFDFYRHFFNVIFSSFKQSIKIAVNPRISNAKIFHLKVKELKSTELQLLIATINLSSGLLFASYEQGKISIFALDDEYLENFNLPKTIKNLKDINDHKLV